MSQSTVTDSSGANHAHEEPRAREAPTNSHVHGASGNAVKATDLSTEGYLSKVLVKLGDNFNMTGQILDKDAKMTANGGYCDVFIGHVHSTSLQNRRVLSRNDDVVKVAIKRLRFRMDRYQQLAKALARELAVWSRLQHPNILPFLGYIEENDYPLLVAEWMEYGTAREFLKSHPDFEIQLLALGVAEGRKYIYDRDVVHSDLQADNILIGENLQPLICDFGIFRMLNSSDSNFVSTSHGSQIRGTTRWMAAELFGPREPKHSKETDVWAFGMTLYEMLSGSIPYAHLKQDGQIVLAISEGQTPAFSEPDNGVSPMLRAICAKCWRSRPRKRPKMGRIIYWLYSDSLPFSEDGLPANRVRRPENLSDAETSVAMKEIRRSYPSFRSPFFPQSRTGRPPAPAVFKDGHKFVRRGPPLVVQGPIQSAKDIVVSL